MGQERKHRRFSPSQSERNFLCLGSTNLLERVPARPSSFYALEGTNAHDVLEAALRNNVRDARVAHEDWSSLFFEPLDDGTNEFYLAVQMAIDHVYSILDEYPDAQLWIERYVDPPVDNAPGEAGGYCDIAIYVPSIRTLFIIDYKHGAGIAKDAKDNPQIAQYGAGFLYEENALIDPASVDSVVLTIVQPRAFHKDGPIREHEVTPYDLWEYLESLDEMIGEAIKPDAPLNPGEDQCRFCDAATVCPAREAQALQVAGGAFKQISDVKADVLPLPQHMDVNRIGLIRAHANTLRKWLDDVDKHAEELARSGHHIPGAKLVEVQARRKYYGDDTEVARKLAALLGERDADAAMAELDALFKARPTLRKLFNFKLVPITSAEKMVVEAYKQRVGRGRKKKAAEEGKQSFAYLTLKQSSGNLTLVDEDDPRPAVNKAQNTFAQITGAIVQNTEDNQ